MKTHEKLANIIKKRGLTKKEFSQKLINLSPNVNRVGETPTVSTIYGYINGRISMPLDLVPYVAEVLDISEQELFDTSASVNKKYFLYLLENSSDEELLRYQKILSNKLFLSTSNIKHSLAYQEEPYQAKIKEILIYIKYAPISFIDKVLLFLKKYKALSDDFK